MQSNRTNFLRFLLQSEPGELAIANGLRAALGLGIPMLLGQLIDQRQNGLFVALMAFSVNLANVGGPYRIKATAMAIATLGIAVSAFVGTLVAGVPVLSVVLTFLLMTLLVYMGRFTKAVTVLAVHLEHFQRTQPLPELETFVRQISLLLEQLAQSAQQEVAPPPLPDLEETLQKIQPHLQALRIARIQELAVNQGHTPRRQAVIDYSILDMEIDQIVRRLSAMHSAMVRLSTQL
ncbi:hypothetical protein [Brasilonema bromeliae]|nr:hypothetical protein [Brasilonema bromeliae]